MNCGVLNGETVDDEVVENMQKMGLGGWSRMNIHHVHSLLKPLDCSYLHYLREDYAHRE